MLRFGSKGGVYHKKSWFGRGSDQNSQNILWYIIMIAKDLERTCTTKRPFLSSLDPANIQKIYENIWHLNHLSKPILVHMGPDFCIKCFSLGQVLFCHPLKPHTSSESKCLPLSLLLVGWFSNQSLQYTSFPCHTHSCEPRVWAASQRPAMTDQRLVCSQGFLRSLTQGQQSTPSHIVDPVKHGVSPTLSSEMKDFEAWANHLAVQLGAVELWAEGKICGFRKEADVPVKCLFYRSGKRRGIGLPYTFLR